MKTLYGVQLGNYLKLEREQKIVRVNSMTKRKIGYVLSGTKETYSYLYEVTEIPINLEILGPYLDNFEDYKFTTTNELVFIPRGTTNIYRISYFHELQNILELHNIRIEWKK